MAANPFFDPYGDEEQDRQDRQQIESVTMMNVGPPAKAEARNFGPSSDEFQNGLAGRPIKAVS